MKTVIEMAIEVGISDLTIGLYQQELERFAELVRADEREACAKMADDQWVRNPNLSGGDAIRGRGKASIRSNT